MEDVVFEFATAVENSAGSLVRQRLDFFSSCLGTTLDASSVPSKSKC